jgi:hypothetical protein
VVLGPGLLEGVVNPIRLVAMVIAMIAAGVANRQL